MPAQMMAAVLEHFACYVQTGSVKAAHRALVLLERLARDAAIDENVREQGCDLAEIIEAALLLARRSRFHSSAVI